MLTYPDFKCLSIKHSIKIKFNHIQVSGGLNQKLAAQLAEVNDPDNAKAMRKSQVISYPGS